MHRSDTELSRVRFVAMSGGLQDVICRDIIIMRVQCVSSRKPDKFVLCGGLDNGTTSRTHHLPDNARIADVIFRHSKPRNSGLIKGVCCVELI